MLLITSEEFNVCDAASFRLAGRITAGEKCSTDDVVAAVERAVDFLGGPLGEDAKVRCLRFLEEKFVVSQAPGGGLGSELNKTPIPAWVPRSKPSQDWPFWYRYQKAMKSKMSPNDFEDLDDYTDRILNKIGDPQLRAFGHPPLWDIRGMAVGHVQAGKTSNYIGLICKAADAGYKMIVVLSGIHENLRVQTQKRIDEGFIGMCADGDPRNPLQVTGVGRTHVPGLDKQPLAYWGTTQNPGGDFRANSLTRFSMDIRSDLPPVVLVVKKNASVLRTLLKWVVGKSEKDLPNYTESHKLKYEELLHDVPHCYRKGCPLLVIDDEADQASVDTRAGNIDEGGGADPDHDPTTINRLIRSLLRSFDQSSYVGYTATPFANILMHEGACTKTQGDDLFPRNFIVKLPTSSAYVGPSTVFGLTRNEDIDVEEQAGLPELIVDVDDHVDSPANLPDGEGWLSRIHVTPHHIDELPKSLQDAILDWVLAGAGMVVRGRGQEHHSMLVHVTRLQVVMGALKDQVDKWWETLADRIAHGERATLSLLQSRWKSFPAAREAVLAVRPQDASLLTPIAWADLTKKGKKGLTPLQEAVAGVKVLAVHGGETQSLEYRDNQQLKVIAIGGNKLSRGLTLENLTVSYFLRASKMYDTLMQMGRWFGYRPGSLDLCRLYLPTELKTWFLDMSNATEELRSEFERMAAQGASPEEFGLRVRSHPVMTVTSSIKMRNGHKVLVSFSDTRPESLTFDTSSEVVAGNWEALRSFVSAMGTPTSKANRALKLARPNDGEATYHGHAWQDVPYTKVVSFLRSMRPPAAPTIAHGPRLAEYISKLAHLEPAELCMWTVFLRHTAEFAPDTLPNGASVGRARRGRYPQAAADDRGKLATGALFSIKSLIDSTYESVDIGREDYERAISMNINAHAEANEKTGRNPAGKVMTSPGPMIRAVRPRTHGLLLLYTVQPYDRGREAKEGVAKTEDIDIKLGVDLPLVGFGVSFPRSKSDSKVEYIVGNVFMTMEWMRNAELEDG